MREMLHRRGEPHAAGMRARPGPMCRPGCAPARCRRSTSFTRPGTVANFHIRTSASPTASVAPTHTDSLRSTARKRPATPLAYPTAWADSVHGPAGTSQIEKRTSLSVGLSPKRLLAQPWDAKRDVGRGHGRASGPANNPGRSRIAPSSGVAVPPTRPVGPQRRLTTPTTAFSRSRGRITATLCSRRRQTPRADRRADGTAGSPQDDRREVFTAPGPGAGAGVPHAFSDTASGGWSSAPRVDPGRPRSS